MANPMTDAGEQGMGVEPKAAPDAYRLPPTTNGVNPRGTRAFTLIELLTVIAIIGLLATITITAGRGIHERSAIARAKADMAVLAAALEQYKQHYGDYPWTPVTPPTGMSDPKWDGGAVLFNALCGNLGPKANAALVVKGRTFVELARFNLDNPEDLPEAEYTNLKVNWFNDPWGGWYYYVYKKSGTDTSWKTPGFLLYCHGPDQQCNVGDPKIAGTYPANTGFLENFPSGTDAINADNIYYGRN